MLAQNEYERLLANLDDANHDDDAIINLDVPDDADEGDDAENDDVASGSNPPSKQRTSSLAGRKRGFEEANKQGLCLFYILHFSDPIYKVKNYKLGEMNLNLTIHLLSKSTY
jgi:hypothetical protein